MSTVTAITPRWYALHTHVNQEARAGDNLAAWGVETFVPQFKERRSNPYTNRPIYVTRPLFSRYIFAQFEVNRMLRKVWYTRGVCRVVGFAEGPTPVEDEVIALIKSR